MKITVRNLRIREDTPKYLRNLALDRYEDSKFSYCRFVTVNFTLCDELLFMLVTSWKSSVLYLYEL